MKILVAGDFRWEIYEDALVNGFRFWEADVHCFKWGQYFEGGGRASEIARRLQNKFLAGPIIRKINDEFLDSCRKIEPDMVFIYRGTHIYPETLGLIKKRGALVFGYHNDDPFSKNHPKYSLRHYLRSLPFYDQIFAYRQKNIFDYQKKGINGAKLLLPYYIKEKNYPLSKIAKEKYISDVTFVGHFENDGRDEFFMRLLEENINFRIWGPRKVWSKSKHFEVFEERTGKIYGLVEDYNLALNSAKICLSFLSKINNDTYTRRSFEIPASKTFMLSEYSDDLNEIFREGIEAEYFRDQEEMLDKVKYYLLNDYKREKIAQEGYRRLLKKGHEIKDRAKEILDIYNCFLK
jgi:spore maturation protein CgeB